MNPAKHSTSGYLTVVAPAICATSSNHVPVNAPPLPLRQPVIVERA